MCAFLKTRYYFIDICRFFWYLCRYFSFGYLPLTAFLHIQQQKNSLGFLSISNNLLYYYIPPPLDASRFCTTSFWKSPQLLRMASCIPLSFLPCSQPSSWASKMFSHLGIKSLYLDKMPCHFWAVYPHTFFKLLSTISLFIYIMELSVLV